MRLCRYRVDISGSRNAALIMLARTMGSAAVKADARWGFVDHTRDEAVSDSGRKAIGPVGRNRWYAVVFGGSNVLRGEWKSVATMPLASYDHPNDGIRA
jgi:hypothetical protein